MDQRIGFATSADGTRLAYAVVGHGFPLVRTATWLTGIEHDADHPMWRHWWQEFARDHTFVRYDQRGCGLSTRKVDNFSLDARVQDLEAIIDHHGFERVDLFGHSHGVPVSIVYAARHPERVHRIILFNGFAKGPYAEWRPSDVHDVVWQLTQTSWNEPKTRRLYAVWNMPTATPDVVEATIDLLYKITSVDNIVDLMSAATHFDVTDSLRSVRAPALVMQSTEGEINPAENNRVLASLLPNAISVDIESKNNILRPDEPGWQTFVNEFRTFCTAPDTDLQARTAAQAEHSLSVREVQVLRLIADGKTDKAIGGALGISARTVSNHVKSILQKTETENRAHAVAWAARQGTL